MAIASTSTTRSARRLGWVRRPPRFARAGEEARHTLGRAHSADANGPYFVSLLLEQKPDVTILDAGHFYGGVSAEARRVGGSASWPMRSVGAAGSWSRGRWALSAWAPPQPARRARRAAATPRASCRLQASRPGCTAPTAASATPVQVYLDEHVFRHNRRRTPMAAFQTLLGLGARHQPTTYDQITRWHRAAA